MAKDMAKDYKQYSWEYAAKRVAELTKRIVEHSARLEQLRNEEQPREGLIKHYAERIDYCRAEINGHKARYPGKL